MQKNRRVEIVFAIEIKEEEIVAVDAIPIDTCTYETTIIQNGVRFTMNICDYDREKACLSFSTYLSPDEILEAGLTTMTSTGSPLISGGMVEINKCTDACITVRMPVRRNLCENGLGMTIWSISENGGWIETDMETEVEKDGDSTFYVIEVCKSGILNCDKPSKPPLYTISTRNRLKIISATLSFEGPLYSYTESEDKPDRKVKIPAPCPCTSPLLSMTAIDKHGDTVSMVLEPINQFKKRTWFKGCKEEQIGSFLFFKFYQKRLYRKYIIRRSDFDKQGVRGL